MKSENVLKEIWKDERIEVSDKATIKQMKVKQNLETETWKPENEEKYASMRKDIRSRLTKHATTSPWDKVLMGAYTQMFKDSIKGD